MSLETRKFDAEIGKVLNLMIHSLYTNKEIFLRELISNASDACDKLRYLSISQPDLIADDHEFKIQISVDQEARKIIISDNGIGMDKQDLIENLGTIAKSGTQSFIEQITGDQKKDTALIGQFGVGFYSTYMIADHVEVISRKAGQEQSYSWSSKGAGEYSIDQSSRAGRGTDIIISVKEGDDDYLDHFRLKHIIKTYSDHINVPIYFEHNGVNTQVNSSAAIWTRPKAEISTQEYQEFYKTVSFAADEPCLTLHNRNEGAIEFINLLFIPTNKTFDLFHPDRKRRVKLYIKRVFVTDENIEIVPRYMRFIRGVVDCDSLPLNISRETLQHNPVVDKIRTSIVSRVLSELKKLKESDEGQYANFWHNFGAAMKEGLCENISEAEKLLDICIFHSALQGKMISLAQYVEKFTSGQKEIYYITGESLDKLKNSPQIEVFKKNNIDVLLFTDGVDDFWVNIVSKFKEFELKSVTRSDIDLKQYLTESDKQDQAQSDEQYGQLIEYFKNTLAQDVKDIKISKKLESIAACLVVDEGSMTNRMERILLEQKQLLSSSAKILEINPSHPFIQKIQHDIKANSADEDTAQLAKLIYDQACIIEEEPVKDPAEFCRRLNKFIKL